MWITFRRSLDRLSRDERGQGGLIAVLVLLVFGGFMIPPMLDLVGTSLLTGEVHERSLEEFYAADAGIEDALFQIKTDQLSTLFPDYDPYHFSDDDESNEYRYSDYPATASAPQFNDKEVDISIENVWVPSVDDIPMPDSAEAQQVLDDAKMVLTSSTPDADTYRIRITYNYQDIDDPDWQDLQVDKVAIWMPPGFSLQAGSSNLEQDPLSDYYCVPTTEPYKSGQLIEWDFVPNVPFEEMPGVDDEGYPLITTVEFDFDGPSNTAPQAALGWVTTTGVWDDLYAWDADVRVFHLASTAGDAGAGTTTSIAAHTAKSEIRRLTSAIAGDYYATGSSLLEATGDDRYRNRLHKESSATVQTDETGADGIPSQGLVEAAYLYWTGWIDWHGYDPTGVETQIFFDDCAREPYGVGFDNWNEGDAWGLSQRWQADYAFYCERGGFWDSVITLDPSHDLEPYADQTVTISWRVWGYSYYYPLEPDDCFRMQFSGDGGASWGDADGNIGDIETVFCDDDAFGDSPDTARHLSYDVPAAYLTDDFRVRFQGHFQEDYNGDTDVLYFDDFTITAIDESAGGSLEYPDEPTASRLETLVEDSARVNKVMFGTSEDNAQEITADQWETLEPDDVADYGLDGTWYYNCVADVTDVIQQYINDEDIDNNAAGTYTLGHVVADNEVDPSYSFDLYPSGSGSTGYPLGTPACDSGYSCPARHNSCHAGWSLLIIYTSPETKGHQLYLYDIQNPDFEFFEAWHTNPDFDGDGEPGGTISGFLVPEPIEGETFAGKITVFVGEGDESPDGDYFIVNDTDMSNSESPADNVWNSASPGLDVPGVDIDTFMIEWDDDILNPGDTLVQIDMPTGGRDEPYGYSGGTEYRNSDLYTTVYIILSFRSDVTTGGTISFLLSG